MPAGLLEAIGGTRAVYAFCGCQSELFSRRNLCRREARETGRGIGSAVFSGDRSSRPSDICAAAGYFLYTAPARLAGALPPKDRA